MVVAQLAASIYIISTEQTFVTCHSINSGASGLPCAGAGVFEAKNPSSWSQQAASGETPDMDRSGRYHLCAGNPYHEVLVIDCSIFVGSIKEVLFL